MNRTLAAPLAFALVLAACPAAIAQAPAASKAAENASTGAPALIKGMTVKDASGVTLGEISRISRKSDGSVREVLVTARDGETHFRMAGAALTVQGEIAVTASSVTR